MSCNRRHSPERKQKEVCPHHYHHLLLTPFLTLITLARTHHSSPRVFGTMSISTRTTRATGAELSTKCASYTTRSLSLFSHLTDNATLTSQSRLCQRSHPSPHVLFICTSQWPSPQGRMTFELVSRQAAKWLTMCAAAYTRSAHPGTVKSPTSR